MESTVGRQYGGARQRLIEELRTKGVRDLAVLRAFDLTPRHLFVPTGIQHRAYDDVPLPIGSGQTISQPTVHARTLELLALTGTERVLEVGTGSGYQTVLLAHLAAQVFSVERIAELMVRATEVIRACEVHNVTLLVGDGTHGWNAHAPYDAIVVGAASPDVPQPLVDQLAEGGRLIVPVGTRDEQRLVLVRRTGDSVQKKVLDPVRFVPLLGEHGWTS